VRPRVLNGSKNRAPSSAATAAAAVSTQHANSPRITQLPSHADRRRRRLSDGLFTLLNLACMSAVAPGQPPPPPTHSRTPTHAHARAYTRTRTQSVYSPLRLTLSPHHPSPAHDTFLRFFF